MKIRRNIFAVVCIASSLCFAQGSLCAEDKVEELAHQTTPGEKVDHAIDAVKKKGKEVGEAVEEKVNEVRDDVGEKVKHS